MDFLLSLIPSSAMGWVNVVALAVACSSGVATAIAKLTANTADDELAAWLRKAHDVLAGVGLHSHTLDQKRAVDVAVRDHR